MGGFFTTIASAGENKRIFATATGLITIYFQNDTNLDSNDDTDIVYYFDTSKSRRKIQIRSNQSLEIISFRDTTFTDPISVVIGDGTVVPASASFTFEFDEPYLNKMVINVLTANTTIDITVL